MQNWLWPSSSAYLSEALSPSLGRQYLLLWRVIPRNVSISESSFVSPRIFQFIFLHSKMHSCGLCQKAYSCLCGIEPWNLLLINTLEGTNAVNPYVKIAATSHRKASGYQIVCLSVSIGIVHFCLLWIIINDSSGNSISSQSLFLALSPLPWHLFPPMLSSLFTVLLTCLSLVSFFKYINLTEAQTFIFLCKKRFMCFYFMCIGALPASVCVHMCIPGIPGG